MSEETKKPNERSFVETHCRRQLEHTTNELEQHKQVIRSIVQIRQWMDEVNIDSYDKYYDALSERIEMAKNLLSQNNEETQNNDA